MTSARSNFLLSPEQRADARAAFIRLAGSGMGLEEAAIRALAAHRKAAVAVPVGDAISRFVRSRISDQCRARTVEWYEDRLARMFAARPDTIIGRIDRTELRRWIAESATTESTRAANARACRTLWRWALAQEPQLVAEDVTSGLRTTPPRNGDSKPIEFLSVEDCAKIMHNGAEYRSAFALMLFAGIRPEEVAGRGKPWLRWEHVNTRERLIRIPPEIAKTRRARIIEGLPPTLWRWLEPSRPDAQISPCRGVDCAQRVAAGFVDHWPHDAFRHSFATYAVALLADFAQVALWMGHEGNPTMLHVHYRGLARKADAVRFWALKP
jgi:integrase